LCVLNRPEIHNQMTQKLRCENEYAGRLFGHYSIKSNSRFKRAGKFYRGSMIKKLSALLLCITFPVCAMAGDVGYKVTYDGGSVSSAKSGTDMKLSIEGSNIKVWDKREVLATIPAESVTEISYGQDVHRRVGAAIGVAVVSFGLGALLALSKSKKHYIGLTWDNKGQKGGFAFQADKNEYRGILAGLEGVTGKKAVDSDAMTVKN